MIILMNRLFLGDAWRNWSLISFLSSLIVLVPIQQNGINSITAFYSGYSDYHSLSKKEVVWLSSDHKVRIPLKRTGRLLYLEAIIDGQSGNLIFDTGAQGLVLNKAYFQDGKPVYHTDGGGISGSSGQVFRKKVDEVNLGALAFRNIQAHLVHLGHIENKRGIKVLGLLGISMLEDFEIIVDMLHSSLELFIIDQNGDALSYPFSRRMWSEEHPVSYSGNIVCTKLLIGGKKVSMCFDTAAEMTYIDSRAGKKVLDEITISRKVVLSGAGATTMEVLYGQLSGFKIGNKDVNDFPVLIGPMDEMNKAYGLQLKGMLGFDFLQLGAIKINLRKKLLLVSFYNLQ